MKKGEMGRIKINKKEGFVTLSLNPKVYPLDVVYSASYVFLDKSYVLLDGNPKREVIVELRFKERKGSKKQLERLGRDFLNELVNYADYRERAEKTKEIRQILLQRALITNDFSVIKKLQSDNLDRVISGLEKSGLSIGKRGRKNKTKI